jgi:hypothetical protein
VTFLQKKSGFLGRFFLRMEVRLFEGRGSTMERRHCGRGVRRKGEPV